MHGNLAAHLGDEFPDECEADAALAFVNVFAGLAATEYYSLAGFGDAHTGIFYLDADTVVARV